MLLGALQGPRAFRKRARTFPGIPEKHDRLNVWSCDARRWFDGALGRARLVISSGRSRRNETDDQRCECIRRKNAVRLPVHNYRLHGAIEA
jgi:hypothetical protein